MACCLTAPSHYLIQCCLIIGEVPWHSSQGIILRRCEDNNQYNEIENCSFTMASRSPRGQWVNNSSCKQHMDATGVFLTTVLQISYHISKIFDFLYIWIQRSYYNTYFAQQLLHMSMSVMVGSMESKSCSCYVLVKPTPVKGFTQGLINFHKYISWAECTSGCQNSYTFLLSIQHQVILAWSK